MHLVANRRKYYNYMIVNVFNQEHVSLYVPSGMGPAMRVATAFQGSSTKGRRTLNRAKESGGVPLEPRQSAIVRDSSTA
jgi:hypothetical protein